MIPRMIICRRIVKTNLTDIPLCPLIQIQGVTIWSCVERCWLAPAAALLILSAMPSHGTFPCDVAKKKNVLYYQNFINDEHNRNELHTVQLPIAAAIRLHSITLYSPRYAIMCPSNTYTTICSPCEILCLQQRSY